MAVKIVNLRWKKAPTFRCDRSSPVGNPFLMLDSSTEERDRVCDLYYDYFQKNLNPDDSPYGFLEYLDQILQAASERDITLGCWCAPKRCHCETIKDYVEREVINYAKRTDIE